MAPEQLTHPKYRRDIDGLRAIAVLAVVGFHAAPGRIPGGFIGVDIFFVISGYLITTIIVNNLEKGSFSFIEFYRRRIRRIFPALITTLLACLIAGSLLLTPEQYENLGKHIAGGAGFYANYTLWQESGYFDNASEMKPLLHLWSLAIEEQFYIVWPLLLWLAFQKKTNWLTLTLTTLIISFCLNIYTSSPGSSAAFYSPLSRFWELLTGSFLAYSCTSKTTSIFHSRSFKNTINFAGAASIAAGFLLINRNSSFPGWWAVLPVTGSALMIAAGPKAWFNRVVLSNRLFVWFGLISYPLYLTHWPLLSFLRIMEGQEIGQGTRLVVVILSIGISWLIVRFIEKPIRFGSYSPLKITALISTMVIIGSYGFYVDMKNGLVGRLGSQPQVANMGEIGQREFFEYMNKRFYPCTPIEIQKDMGFWEEFQRCYQSKKSTKKQVALIGDSHAEHFFIGLAEELAEINVVYYAKGGIPFLSNTNYDNIFRYILQDNNIKVVVVSAHWARDLGTINGETLEDKFTYLIEYLLDAGKKIYIVDDVPQFTFGPSKCKYANRLGAENLCSQENILFNTNRENYYPILKSLTESYSNVDLIETEHFFCKDARCFMAEDGILYYRDSHHLGINGSKMLWHDIMKNTTMHHDITSWITD